MRVCSFADMSNQVDSHNSKGGPAEEQDCGIYRPKLHSLPPRTNNNIHPNPCASPKSPHQFIYPYNGSTPVLHTGTNSHHPLDTLRRLHHPPSLLLSSTSAPNTSFPSYSAVLRSPRTPTPQSVNQGQRTPKTPDSPGSPQLGSLSSPPPSSPMTHGGGGKGIQTHAHHPHSVIVGSSPISPSPSRSPSVHNMNCASPHQRSRHPSASLSPLSEQGGGSTAVEGGGLMGSNMAQRRKSSSSSPHSPLPSGSPNPSPHFHKYKLEDILEQFKNSGNSSTTNHQRLSPTNPSLLTNQSGNPPSLALKSSKSTMSLTSSTGPTSLGFNSAGPSSLPLGPFLNHHSNQGKLPHPASFPASSMLSAAAKAQLANQVTQSHSSNAASNSLSLPPSMEVLKGAQQQQSSKVTNSTLHNSHPPCLNASRAPNPSLAAASNVLVPPCHSLAQSLASSLPHLPPTAERSASHRKRQRRSPTVLNMLRDTQQLVNGLPKTPSGDSVSATVINLSSASSSLHSSSTSTVQNAVVLENHHHLLSGQLARLPALRQTAPHPRPSRQNEALDFTTGSSSPLSLDPPTQPLSALLHLLSVQNAQATASACASASAQTGSVEGGGHTNKQSPRLSPISPTARTNVRHLQTLSPCRTNDTNLIPLVPRPLSPPASTHFTSVQAQSNLQPTKSAPLQKHSPGLHNSSSSSRHSSPSPSVKHLPTENHNPTIDSNSQSPLRESSPQGSVIAEMGGDGISASVDLSQSQSNVSVVMATSPKPLDLSNHVLALLAASSTLPQGEGSPPGSTTDVDMSSQENHTAGRIVPSI